MTFKSSGLTALVVAAGLAVAGCGSPRVTTSTVTVTPTPTRAPTASPTAVSGVAQAALTAADIVNSGLFSQKSDSLLGGLADTDARVFANTDSTIVVEVDLVSDTGAAGAASDYPPYQSAAAKQAGTRPATSSPGLGQQSNEFIGTNSAGKNVVSISFIEGSYIVVLTTVGNSTVAMDVVKTSAESIAQAQDNKINSIGS